MNAELLVQARAGDGDAFAELVAPYQRELELHCYRLLGSHHDAEDVMQNALLSAWQSLPAYEGRSSLRTWLYRVATSRCLDARRSARRHPEAPWPLPEIEPLEPTRRTEVVWLEPYPDALLDTGPTAGLRPEARYETREAISLAFIVALQVLPPRQRAALILRDVLGFSGREASEMLEVGEEAISSALRRARAALARHLAQSTSAEPPPLPDSPPERAVLARLTDAYDRGDLDTVLELLADDVWVRMPPLPLEYQGRQNAAWFLGIVFRDSRSYRLLPTRANGQLAFGSYLRTPNSDVLHATGLLVITLAGDRVSGITRFDNDILARFGLPRNLPS